MYAQQQQQQQEAAWQSVEERLCLLKKHVGTDSFVDNNPCILNDRGAEWLPSGRSRDSEVEIWHGYHYHYHYHLHVCRSKLCQCGADRLGRPCTANREPFGTGLLGLCPLHTHVEAIWRV